MCTTKKDINNLIEFHQAIYANGLLARRDALFDLVDALLSAGPVLSFAMLGQSDHLLQRQKRLKLDW